MTKLNYYKIVESRAFNANDYEKAETYSKLVTKEIKKKRPRGNKAAKLSL